MPALPQLVKDIIPGFGSSSPEGLTVFNDKLYFSARASGTGHELWVTDSTDVGTQLVKDINPGVGSSYPKDFCAFNGRLFFTADDGSTGEELWVTDGTDVGTQLLKDIRPGTGSSLDFINYPPNFTVFNGRLFFTANDGINGRELWSTDGTTAGTQLFKDIFPGINGSSPTGMTVFNGKLIFAAQDPTTARELWISDGTVAGTQLLKDISWRGHTGFWSSSPENFTILGNKLFFTAREWQGTGDELWVTDGTTAGTQLIKDIRPGGNIGSGPQSLTVVNDKLFFSVNDGTNGEQVWVSDGTAAGTQLTKNISSGFSIYSPRNLTAFNGKLFFSANDGTYGREVWFSDGTAAGTQLLKDITPGAFGSIIEELAVFDGKLFISAGSELWVSDGTTAGTQLVSDIFSNNPENFTILGDRLLFTASTFTSGSRTGTGTELWKIDATTPSLTIAPTNADRPEGNTDTTPFTFTVTRSGDTSDTSSVQYAVAGSGSSPTNATDFDGATTGSIEFAANQATATITLNVRGDATIEPDEEFTVTLSNPIRATLATATATGIIRDDDSVIIPTPNPIPTPTPDPVPTPTPDPITTPTPDPITTPTPDPVPTPTPEPIPTPTPEPSTLPSLVRIADDIFRISGGAANKPKLQITISDSRPSSVNELAVFTVDDIRGTIDGIAPTETGYAQAALSRAKVIFSMLANVPQGFDPKSLNRSLEFDSGNNLRFLLIKNDTLDSVRNKNASNPDILFSNASNQKITASSTGSFTLAWEDGNGNSSDFKDFVVNIQATDTPLPLGANLQDRQQGEVLDLSGVDSTKTVQASFTVSREAAYNNSVGLYKVIDYQGTIADPLTGTFLKPGDSGYVEAAIKNRVAGIDLQTANQSTITIDTVFQGGSIFAPFMIANGSVEQLLDVDKSNDPSVYFAYSGANADKVDRIRLLGNNVFGFEDLPGGGDFDYNDMIVKTDISVM
ncbi:ELWxxDGT repeat protein [Oscillatoria sp. FACHB-1406]|uniref:ELWxxDGT repeat protein n=1 Tax=Oscillatoria sp. FACHB-1406 TaxID=2692846 RepID=UPI0016832004|nr:DUF4114 domain-containing protein [Oscillatoria sp. FACHB-1406]